MVRRTVDLLAAAGGLAVLSPALAVIAALVKHGSRGPVFFRQERIGLKGKPFRIIKFRTMAHGAGEGSRVTTAGDSRITPMGTRLRSTKLDELPQLLNVLRGDMSLVGPRPEVREYVELWSASDRSMILSVRPGITDPTTLALRREEELLATAADPNVYYRSVLLPKKVASNVEYVRTRSLLGDARVLLRTIIAVVAK